MGIASLASIFVSHGAELFYSHINRQLKTMGGEHIMQYIYALLLNCTSETYWISLTNVIIIKK